MGGARRRLQEVIVDEGGGEESGGVAAEYDLAIARLKLPKFKIVYRLSNVLHQSERKVYSVFTMIGDIGGFNGAIIILPSFILAQYSGRMFSSSIQEEIPVSKKSKKKGPPFS